MKKIKILYWTFTGLFAFMMLGSAIPDIFSVRIAREGFNGIGMPVYLLPFLGTAKLLGVIALFVPAYPRLKEWAYAGLVFDLVGATYSIIASGQPAGAWVTMIIPLGLGTASYYFYHRKLQAKVSAGSDSDRSNNEIGDLSEKAAIA
ncbi:MAG TPA: DoxX family protein [Chitinophagaceae bacterium]|nr:DoxX family protein [Chitinophagaceae bacterium]